MNKKSHDYFGTDSLKSGLRTRALRGASVTIIAQVVNFGVATVGTIILARILTPEDFGLVAMALTFSLLLQNFGFNGFTEAIIQKSEINHKQISTLFWINISINLGLALLFVAAGPVIAWFYKDPRLIPVVAVIAGSIFFGGLSTEHLALLNRNMQFHITSANAVVATFISVATAIVLALFGWEYWALVTRWVMIPMVTAIGAWILCRWRPGLPARGTGVRPMLRFAMNTYGTFIMNYFRKNLDKILLGRFYGPQSLGNYDRAYHLSNMLPNQLIQPMTTVAIATMSRLADQPDKYRKNYLELMSLLAFIGMPISAIVTVTGSDLILFLLGPQWTLAGQLVSIFGLSVGVLMIYSTHGWLHLSLGTPERWFRWGIIAFFVTAACLLVGIYFGVTSLVISYTVSFYILAGPGLVYAGRPISLKFFMIFSAVWKFYLAALCAGLISWFLLYTYHISADLFMTFHILIRIIIASALCTILYLIVLIILSRGIKPITHFILVMKEMLPDRFSGK